MDRLHVGADRSREDHVTRTLAVKRIAYDWSNHGLVVTLKSSRKPGWLANVGASAVSGLCIFLDIARMSDDAADANRAIF